MNINVGNCIEIYMTNTTNGHNKWYRMTRTHTNADNWKAEWGGLIGHYKGGTKVYQESTKSWYDMCKEKEKKGYVIKTGLNNWSRTIVSYEVPSHLKGIRDKLEALRSMIFACKNDNVYDDNDYAAVSEVLHSLENGETDQIEVADLQAFNELYKKYKKLNAEA